jgi:hypothetical protein
MPFHFSLVMTYTRKCARFNANDPLSTRGLLNITFDAELVGKYIKAQASSCFVDKYKTDFTYGHCTIRDPMVFFKLWNKPTAAVGQ